MKINRLGVLRSFSFFVAHLLRNISVGAPAYLPPDAPIHQALLIKTSFFVVVVFSLLLPRSLACFVMFFFDPCEIVSTVGSLDRNVFCPKRYLRTDCRVLGTVERIEN